MLTETGKIVAIDRDGLWVETLKQSACNQCRASHGCGQRLLATSTSNLSLIKANFSYEVESKYEFNKEKPVKQKPNWKIGDTVEIGIDERALVTSALLAYLSPLFIMMAFALLASFFEMQDSLVGLAAFVGLLVGGGLVKKLSQNQQCQRRYHAIVLSQPDLVYRELN